MRATRRSVMAGAASGVAALLAPRIARAFAGDLADAPFIDAFGPVGTADDTATFVAALGSGKPVRLRAATYRVRGPVRVRSRVVMLHGTPGLSRIEATGLESGPWFRIESDGLVDFQGIVWDGAGAATGSEVGMVSVLGTPETCAFRRCSVLNSTRPAGLLVSINVNGADNQFLRLSEIVANNNAQHGIWIEHAANVVADSLRLYKNGMAGLMAIRFANRAGEPIRRVVLRDCFAWSNGNAGFGLGRYNEAGLGEPEILGPDLPDVVDAELHGIFAWSNGGYGIAVQAEGIRLSGCRTRANGPVGGITVNARQCDIQGCEVADERMFGIDCGGARDVTITDCRFRNITGTGLNPGGSEIVLGQGNRFFGCTRGAIGVWNTETTGRPGGWFKFRAQHIHLRDTFIDISGQSSPFAVVVRDGAQNVHLDGLDVRGDLAGDTEGPNRVLWAVTNSITVSRTRFNGAEAVPVSPMGGRVIVPDMALAVVLPDRFVELTDIVTNTMARIGNGIGWIAVLEPGHGYVAAKTRAVLDGDGDVDAVGPLEPNVWRGGGGQLVGFRLRRHGRGFTRASVLLEGPGSGAVLKVQIGVPLPQDRRLRLIFPYGGKLSSPLPQITLAPRSFLDLHVVNARWAIGRS